ncbi:uncharacterized protein LOC125146765 isoform X2 [Prionailurus viverrinus]|uniref:uncharacterized protein LOC125146765 isoform X2 n=1 Tax=Prionailurus viverrinus TaxID=61388 RepID=UPI001FF64D0C|nr:uncharacterized protein LOC125146765 isoform X2 [Prionailurus viverrinus]
MNRCSSEMVMQNLATAFNYWRQGVCLLTGHRGFLPHCTDVPEVLKQMHDQTEGWLTFCISCYTLMSSRREESETGGCWSISNSEFPVWNVPLLHIILAFSTWGRKLTPSIPGTREHHGLAVGIKQVWMSGDAPPPLPGNTSAYWTHPSPSRIHWFISCCSIHSSRACTLDAKSISTRRVSLDPYGRPVMYV